MPMPNNGFKWRPNDNSSLTNHRYSLEAEKWVTAVSGAIRKNQRSSFSKDLQVIGLFVQLFLSVILFVLLLILRALQGILKFFNRKTENRRKREEMRSKGYSERTISVLMEREKINTLKYSFFYDSRGNLWFLWKFLLMFCFIFSFTFIGMGIYTGIYNPSFNMTEEPFLIFMGGISAWFAFMASG